MPINIDYFFIFFIPIDADADALTPSRNTRSYTKLRFVVPVKDDIVIYHNKKRMPTLNDVVTPPSPNQNEALAVSQIVSSTCLKYSTSLLRGL